MNLNPLRRCWVEIDLSALRDNAEVLQSLAGPGIGLMAVVKADAYGHGLAAVAEALRHQVAGFCVANVTEALQINHQPSTINYRPSIWILSPVTPDECETAVAHGFSCSVSSIEEVETLGNAAKKVGKPAKLHAVADTGMGRMGASPADWQPFLDAIRQNPFCELEGVSTHFPNADQDAAFTAKQIALFRDMTRDLQCKIHLANSAGVIDFSKNIDFATHVRPGLTLYGVSPQLSTINFQPSTSVALRPALTMKSRVTLVRSISAGTTISYGSRFTADRPMLVASIAAGYGDGYPRHLSENGAEVLIQGKRCAVLGRVTMDQIVVDVSHLESVHYGDEVVLLGSQGSENIPATELAAKSGTIPWEIFTSITKRVERVYW